MWVSSGLVFRRPPTVGGRTSPLTPGTSVGAMTSFWDLGIMIAGPLSGVVATHAGYHCAFALAAAITVVALSVPAIVWRSTPSSPPQEPAR